jgi:hypothetical protein
MASLEYVSIPEGPKSCQQDARRSSRSSVAEVAFATPTIQYRQCRTRGRDLGHCMKLGCGILWLATSCERASRGPLSILLIT